MAYFDEHGNFTLNSNASDSARDKALRLHQQAMEKQDRGRVEYGRNDHHREFGNICAGQILYASGLVPLENLSRSVRDEVGGKVNLIAMMRDYISLAGSTPPPIDDKNAILTRALGSSDFPNLVSNVLNKSQIAGFNDAPEVWSKFTDYYPVPDFKSTDFLLGASMSSPEEVPERGELKQAVLYDDGKESDYIRSNVHRLNVTRQMLLNSDTSIARLAFENGKSISRAIGNGVFNLLTDNAALADNELLFSTAHMNIVTTGAAPSVSTLEAAFVAMGAQQNGSGEVLNYKPRFVVSGPGYVSTLAVLRAGMNAGNDGESDGTITTLVDSRLSGSTAWYAIADPMHGGILIAVLAGTEGRPRFEQIVNAPSGAPDGLHFKCGYDFRVVCGNWKALYMNDGA